MTSVSRQWLARVRDLGRRVRRDAQGACIVEGVHAVQQAVAAGLSIEAVLVCPERVRSAEVRDWVRGARARGSTVVELPAGAFARVARVDHPVALVAVVRWRPRRLDELPAGDLVVVALDLDDAGNLGTLIRTADAAGAAAVIVGGAGADPAQRKCLRASLGTAFRLPVARAGTGAEALAWARAGGYRTVATSPGARDSYSAAHYVSPSAVVFGNERHGLDPASLRACDQRVRIPMRGAAESLNVGVAAGIVLFEVRRQIDAARAPPCPEGVGSGVAVPSPVVREVPGPAHLGGQEAASRPSPAGAVTGT